MKKVFVLLCFIFPFSLALSKSISEVSDYPSFCKMAAEDEIVFQSFKRHPTYQDGRQHLIHPAGTFRCLSMR